MARRSERIQPMNKKRKLPAWCSDLKEPEFTAPFALEEEEVQLRRSGYRQAERQLHLIAHESLQSLLQPVFSILEQVVTSSHSVIPVIQIRGRPFAREDEYEMIQAMVKWSKLNLKKSATVWLENDGIEELTRQCLRYGNSIDSASNRLSCREKLVEWASEQTEYDNIVVFGKPSPCFASLRANEGLPIIMVHWSIAETLNYDIWTFDVSIDSWWHVLLARLLLKFPLPFDGELRRSIEGPLIQEHGSVTRAIRGLERVLSTTFSSSWWLCPESCRLEWFLRDERFGISYRISQEQRKELNRIGDLGRLCLRVKYCMESQKDVAVLDKATKREMLALLAPTNMYQLIVYIDHCGTVGEARAVLQEPVAAWSNLLKNAGVWNQDLLEESQEHLEVRRNVVGGLYPIMEVASMLWHFMVDRVSIKHEEWLALFEQVHPDDTLATFCCGVHFLELQGLIRERKAIGRNQIVYEKATVVWTCSG